MSRATSGIVLAVFLAVPSIVGAQTDSPIRVGQRVRVQVRSNPVQPVIAVGTVTAVAADSLILLTMEGPANISVDDIVGLEISDGGRRRLAAGAVIGATTGFAAGVLISLARNSCVCVTENCPACAGRRYQGLDFAMTVKSTAIGGLLGGLLGASRKERWVSIPLDFRSP